MFPSQLGRMADCTTVAGVSCRISDATSTHNRPVDARSFTVASLSPLSKQPDLQAFQEG
jgi:hypothetical protein